MKKMHATLVSAVTALTAVVLLAVASKPNASGPIIFRADTVRVQAALYSGLPNPKWVLETSQLSECLKMLSGLPVSKNQEPERGLGYSGLRLELIQASGAIVAFRIHDGGVWMEDNESVSYTDRGRFLERWIIGTAPSDVRQVMPRELRN